MAAHRDDGKRFVVRADEKLTAFLELEAASRASLQSLITVATGRGSGVGRGLGVDVGLGGGGVGQGRGK